MRKLVLLFAIFSTISCFAQNNGFATFEPIIVQPTKPYSPPPLPQTYSSGMNSQNNQNYSDCHQIPSVFTSYKQAFVAISTCDFGYVDNFDAESSFLKGAVFKSCNGYYGFLVVFIEGYNPYIYQNVPIQIWTGFKNATSTGIYYNNYIRGKYRVYFNN